MDSSAMPTPPGSPRSSQISGSSSPVPPATPTGSMPRPSVSSSMNPTIKKDKPKIDVPSDFTVTVRGRAHDLKEDLNRRVYSIFTDFNQMILARFTDKNQHLDPSDPLYNPSGYNESNTKIEVNLHTKMVSIVHTKDNGEIVYDKMDLTVMEGLDGDTATSQKLIMQKVNDMYQLLVNHDVIYERDADYVMGRDFHESYRYSMNAFGGDDAFVKALRGLSGHDDSANKLSNSTTLNGIKDTLYKELFPDATAADLSKITKKVKDKFEYIQTMYDGILKATNDQLKELQDQRVKNQGTMTKKALKDLDKDIAQLKKVKVKYDTTVKQKGLLFLSLVVRQAYFEKAATTDRDKTTRFSEEVLEGLIGAFEAEDIGKTYGKNPPPKGLFGKIKAAFARPERTHTHMLKRHKDLAALIVGAGVYNFSDTIAEDGFEEFSRNQKFLHNEFLSKHGVQAGHYGLIGIGLRLVDDTKQKAFEANLDSITQDFEGLACVNDFQDRVDAMGLTFDPYKNRQLS